MPEICGHLPAAASLLNQSGPLTLLQPMPASGNAAVPTVQSVSKNRMDLCYVPLSALMETSIHGWMLAVMFPHSGTIVSELLLPASW